MIGRFRDNIFVLSKNIELENYFENQFYKIEGEKISLFSNGFVLKDNKIDNLKPGVYDMAKLAKILFSDEINKESFFNDFCYENDKFIYIHMFKIKYYECKNFKTEFEEIKKAEDFLSDFLDKEFKNSLKEPVLLVFNELIFNAYEHGNLGISFKQKEELLAQSKYMEYLKKIKSDKNIKVCVSKIKYKNKLYLVCKITDEGKGFDLTKKQEALYNGRGLLMTDKICNGVFYNEKGNSVLFIKEMK